jgi:hypothetical protein
MVAFRPGNAVRPAQLLQPGSWLKINAM